MVGLSKNNKTTLLCWLTQHKESSQQALVPLMRYKKRLLLITMVGSCIYAWFNPYQFANLWLTQDQQGRLLFSFKKYELASQRFINSRWKAYSFYGNEQYKQAGMLYGQFNSPEDLLAQANAHAHNKEYVKARALYRDLTNRYPDFLAASHNLEIIEEIINSINLLSESQKPEQTDAPKELGDEPQRADGADKQEARSQEMAQITAEQLRQNPELTQMWLRQVQKNPAQFLRVKFQMELESQNVIKQE